MPSLPLEPSSRRNRGLPGSSHTRTGEGESRGGLARLRKGNSGQRLPWCRVADIVTDDVGYPAYIIHLRRVQWLRTIPAM